MLSRCSLEETEGGREREGGSQCHLFCSLHKCFSINIIIFFSLSLFNAINSIIFASRCLSHSPASYSVTLFPITSLHIISLPDDDRFSSRFSSLNPQLMRHQRQQLFSCSSFSLLFLSSPSFCMDPLKQSTSRLGCGFILIIDGG